MQLYKNLKISFIVFYLVYIHLPHFPERDWYFVKVWDEEREMMSRENRE